MRYYRFADIAFEVDGLPEKLPDGKYLNLFRTASVVPDITLHVQNTTLVLPSDAVRSGNICYVEREGKHRIYGWFRTPNPAISFVLNDWKNAEITVDVHPELYDDAAFTANWLLSLSGFSTGLLYRKCATLHCSYILVENQAILFAGFSGMGKSTQAELWRRYRNAEIINGDRALIFQREDGWYAGGISACGSSKICRNYTAKIAAVILLEKGSDNRVFPMKIAEKYRALLTGMAFHRWKEEEIDTAGNLAMDILSELPMYRLRNRADEESVEVIEKEIGGTLYDI